MSFKLPEKLLFLTSPRFWQVVILAAVTYLDQTGALSHQIAVLLQTIFGASVIITTVDKVGDKVAGAVNAALGSSKK